MCTSFAEINDGKVIKIKGKMKRGRWVFCLQCGMIDKKGKVHVYRKNRSKCRKSA